MEKIILLIALFTVTVISLLIIREVARTGGIIKVLNEFKKDRQVFRVIIILSCTLTCVGLLNHFKKSFDWYFGYLFLSFVLHMAVYVVSRIFQKQNRLL